MSDISPFSAVLSGAAAGLAFGAAAATAATLWWCRRTQRRVPRRLPAHWAVVPRPLFNTDERRLQRRLVEAFPRHLVVPKLQLVRFCHAERALDTRYWFDLLSPLHVSFAVCSDNGRVVLAIDIESHPGRDKTRTEQRTALIKNSALEACRVRYARCPAGQLPALSELQALLPDGVAAVRHPVDQHLQAARHQLAQAVAKRRHERAPAAGGNEFADSFFSADSRFDPAAPSAFGVLTAPDALPVLHATVDGH
jgi:hypothetical protein